MMTKEFQEFLLGEIAMLRASANTLSQEIFHRQLERVADQPELHGFLQRVATVARELTAALAVPLELAANPQYSRYTYKPRSRKLRRLTYNLDNKFLKGGKQQKTAHNLFPNEIS